MAREMDPLDPHLTTVERSLRQGEQIGRGTDGAYYRLTQGPGEPHVRRLELAPDAPAPARRASLLHFVHVTDMHVVDTESPGRFEFVERFYGPEPLHLLLPAYRPQEVLQLHAGEAMIRAVNAIVASPLTGAPVQFLLCTGDQTDNAQRNELHWVVSLMEGATVRPGSGGPAYEGVASVAWGDSGYWHPDPYPDEYKRRWGFPAYPGLLDDTSHPFTAEGAKLPWLSCYGNHDALVQGAARPNPAYERILTGAHKARALPRTFDLLEHLELFIPNPEAFLAGPMTMVTPDPARRGYSRYEFLQAHMQADGEPYGHGFTAQNLAEGTAYYVDDRYSAVRIIVLDTVNPAGNYQGSIGATQLAWLEQRLIEVHARYRDARGRGVETGHEDRLVVIGSHHGLSTLVNDLVAPNGENDLPRVLTPAIASLLHRFPNVILWVNGHTHRNTVRPWPDPTGRSAGFWEVTTASLLDWPCQARLVEIVSNGNGTLSVLCTMVDHAAPADSCSADGLLQLAAIHRELAANDPHCGMASSAQGQRSDRNVELVIAMPFSLD
jgi:metallophosphoesterase (TIGR03767 family)